MINLLNNRLKLWLSGTAGAVLLIGGLIVVAPAFYYDLWQRGDVSSHGLIASNAIVKTDTIKVSGKPMRILVPSVGINLPVIDGFYDHSSGQWTLTPTKAQFATLSSLPNNISGNTLIYGHALPQVFEHLSNITANSTAIVTTSSGYLFTYRYKTTYATSPQDTSVLTYRGAPILTLQTCSGIWSQNRQMYQFDLVGYRKA